MRPDMFLKIAIDPALLLFPEKMRTPEAKAFILAICLQESDLRYRHQVGGPARGYAQFEKAGIEGVLNHRRSSSMAYQICYDLDIEPDVDSIYEAIEYNDILCVSMARLLIWTYPKPLPVKDDFDESWKQYLLLWRPGKPHPEKWRSCYLRAWNIVSS